MIEPTKLAKQPNRALVYVAAFIALFLVGAERFYLRPKGEAASPYHRSVRALAEQIPTSFDGWIGLDVPVPEAAVRILRPNVIVSRLYQNLNTGERVSFLLVQVSDARDILGHYPPVCYPAQGWAQAKAEPHEWKCDASEVVGTRYQFRRERYDSFTTLSVVNVLMLPGGETCRSMEEIESVAQSRERKFFGAGQFQLVTEQPLDAQREAEIVEQFVRLVKPIMELSID